MPVAMSAAYIYLTVKSTKKFRNSTILAGAFRFPFARWCLFTACSFKYSNCDKRHNVLVIE